MPPSVQRRILETECLMHSALLHRLVEAWTDRRYAEAGMADMTAARASVLHALYSASGPITAQQVAEQLGVSKVSASRLVKALEQGRWVARAPHPQDGRAFELRLTAKARKAFPKFVEIHNETLDALFGSLPAAELATLRDRIEGSVQGLRARR